MKKFLILKLMSLLLIGKAYAIQIQHETSNFASSISTATSRPSSPVSDKMASKTEETRSRAVARSNSSARQSLWTVSSAVHEEKLARARSLSRQSQTESDHSFFLQLCSRSTEGLARHLQQSGSLSEKVDAFARAVARAEGFCVVGTIPNRLGNPGDITTSLPHAYPGQIGIYRGYARFKSSRWGWLALQKQIQRIVEGTSLRYTQEMTFAQIAKVYAEDPRWGKRVCKILRIDPRLTFAEYFNLAPRVKMTVNYEKMFFQRMLATFPMVEVVQSARGTEIARQEISAYTSQEGLVFVERVSGDPDQRQTSTGTSSLDEFIFGTTAP